jgi:probable HAF family extracellular repeat protein
MSALPTLGGRNNAAYAINERGDVVGAVETPEGDRAVLWRNGQLIDLGFSGRPLDMNNRGDIVGETTESGDSRAFLWRNGQLTDLGVLAGVRSTASSISESGIITGYSNYSDVIVEQGRYHAVVWKDGSMHDLGTFGGTQSYAMSINSKGDIAGTSVVSH